MEALYINTSRTGCAPDQCGKTMTVGDLISLLEEFDEDRPVYFRNDNGYTYGSLDCRDIVCAEDYDEE